MSSNKFKGISVVQNMEIYVGVHRCYGQYKNTKAYIFISLHIVMRIILSIYTAVLAIESGRFEIDFITYYTWMLYLLVQVFEIITIQISAVRYSDEYIKLINTLQCTSKLVNVKDSPTYNKYVWYLRSVNFFLIVMFLFNLIGMWFSPMFDLSFFKIVLLAFSWHSMLFTHLLQDALCAFIFNIIAGIVNAMDDNLLHYVDNYNNKSQKLIQKIISIEKKEEEVSLDRFWSVYEGIESSCTSFNKIFAGQSLVSVLLTFLCNFTNIFSILIHTEKISALSVIIGSLFYLVILLSLYFVIWNGQNVYRSIERLRRHIAKFNNFLGAENSSSKSLLRLLKCNPPQLLAGNMIEYRMPFVPAFITFAITYAISFLQLYHVL